MVYYKKINRIREESIKELWILRDFQEKYHPELPIPRLSTLSDDLERLDRWYATLAQLYIREVHDDKLTIIIV